jgi:hypothetical protein
LKDGLSQIEANFFQPAFLPSMSVELRMLATLALLLAEKSCRGLAAALLNV